MLCDPHEADRHLARTCGRRTEHDSRQRLYTRLHSHTAQHPRQRRARSLFARQPRPPGAQSRRSPPLGAVARSARRRGHNCNLASAERIGLQRIDRLQPPLRRSRSCRILHSLLGRRVCHSPGSRTAARHSPLQHRGRHRRHSHIAAYALCLPSARHCPRHKHLCPRRGRMCPVPPSTHRPPDMPPRPAHSLARRPRISRARALDLGVGTADHSDELHPRRLYQQPRRRVGSRATHSSTATSASSFRR